MSFLSSASSPSPFVPIHESSRCYRLLANRSIITHQLIPSLFLSMLFSRLKEIFSHAIVPPSSSAKSPIQLPQSPSQGFAFFSHIHCVWRTISFPFHLALFATIAAAIASAFAPALVENVRSNNGLSRCNMLGVNICISTLITRSGSITVLVVVIVHYGYPNVGRRTAADSR